LADDNKKNPSWVYAGIPGPDSIYDITRGPVQIPKAQIIEDLVSVLKKMPLTDNDAERLYLAILNRVRAKTCVGCGKLRPVVFGKLVYHPSGDLSKPKEFWCSLCKD